MAIRFDPLKNLEPRDKKIIPPKLIFKNFCTYLAEVFFAANLNFFSEIVPLSRYYYQVTNRFHFLIYNFVMR